jgi:hypothetical protein
MGLAAAVATEFFVPESPIRTPARIDLRARSCSRSVSCAADRDLPGARRRLGQRANARADRSRLVVLAFWVALERRTTEPLADITALTKPPVLMTNIATLLVGFGMFGSFVLIPTLAEAPTSTGYGFGADATRAGLLLLPGCLRDACARTAFRIIGTRVGNKVPLTNRRLPHGARLALLSVSHETQLEVVTFALLMSAASSRLRSHAESDHRVGAAAPDGEATGFKRARTFRRRVLRLAGVGHDPRRQRRRGRRNRRRVLAGIRGVRRIAACGTFARSSRGPGRRAHAPVLDEIGAASPLGDPSRIRKTPSPAKEGLAKRARCRQAALLAPRPRPRSRP